MNRSHLALRVSSLALSIALLGGCSDEKDGAARATTPGTEKAAKGDAGTAAPSQVATVDPDKVIARQTFKLRKKPEDTVEVGLVSLTVSGKIATLQLVLTPRFKSEPAGETIDIFDIYEGSSFNPYLLDVGNLKRYDVVRGGGSRFASDSVESKTVNGTPMSAFAVFAAPEDAITTVDVHASDWWPAFKAVAFQR